MAKRDSFQDLVQEYADEQAKFAAPVEMPEADEATNVRWQDYVSPAILPTVGAIGGGVIGTAMGTAIGQPVLGGIAMGAMGAGAGESANQILGITQPNPQEIQDATTTSALFGAGGAGLARLKPYLMPGDWAKAFNALGGDLVKQNLKKYASATRSSQLFEAAEKADVRISMKKTNALLDDLIEQTTNVSSGVAEANALATRYLKGLKEKIAFSPYGPRNDVGHLSPRALQRELAPLGGLIASIEKKGGTNSGVLKQAHKAMLQDLDEAIAKGGASSAAANTLAQARHLFKREALVDDIERIIKKQLNSPKRGQGSDIEFNAGAIIRKIKGDDRQAAFWKDAFTAAERADIENTLHRLNKIPALRPGAGVDTGSKRVMNQLAIAAAGGGLAHQAGGSVGGTMLATGASFAIPPTMEIARDFAIAVSLGSGRALLRELLKQSNGSYTPAVATVVGAFASAVNQGQVNDNIRTLAEQFQKGMRN